MTAKKKKKGKGLLFAVLILIVLLVLYFVIDLQQKKADQEAETEETKDSSLPVSVTDDEIAKRLHISIHTVKKYVKTLLQKTGFTTRTQLAVMARESGIVIRGF